MVWQHLLNLLERGCRRPRKIPRYVFGLLFPSSQWGATWHRSNGVVRFESGGYTSSPRNRPEFAANLYHEVTGLNAVLDDVLESPPATSLEVGCGYGRLSPWIGRRSETHHGVDPDAAAIRRAATLYPECSFALGRVQSLPYRDNIADVLVTWTVLQHVSAGSIRASIDELKRVLAPGGILVACERVRPPADDHIWPRPVSTYERLFEPLELVDVRLRPVEPAWEEAMPTPEPSERVLVFRA